MTDLVARVERAGYRSWPAREHVDYRGWQLRYADGFSRRANSALALGTMPADLDSMIQYCADWFAARGLDLVIRMTPLAAGALDSNLAERGFSREGDTYVMVGELPAGDWSQIEVNPEPATGWWSAMASLWNIHAGSLPAWQGIINRIESPAAFGLIEDSATPLAAGLGVLDEEWLGLFEIIVAKTMRRRGLGTQLTSGLMGWGHARGATHGYLQVMGENEGAIALYESLGFRKLYRYWYRRTPG